MLNINEFRPVVHKKKIFKGFCFFIYTRGPRGFKLFTWGKCLKSSFAQNYINYMPILKWRSKAKLIVIFKWFKVGLKCDPRSLTFAYFNLHVHFIQYQLSKCNCIWCICTYENKTFLSIMLYIVLCKSKWL